MKTLLLIIVLLSLSSGVFAYGSGYGYNNGNYSSSLNQRIANQNAAQQHRYINQNRYYHVESQDRRYRPQVPQSTGSSYEHEIGGLAGRPNSWE